MMKKKNNRALRLRRQVRIRGKITGTAERPRVAVFRSLKSIGAQIINDVAGKTLAQANLSEVTKAKNNVAAAREVGKILGAKATKLGLKTAVFDRAGYKYHGRVKELAEGVREAGISM